MGKTLEIRLTWKTRSAIIHAATKKAATEVLKRHILWQIREPLKEDLHPAGGSEEAMI